MNNGQGWINFGAVAAVVVAFALIFAKNVPGNTHNQLLNVTYDPTRELYQRLNAEFVATYEKRSGRHITVVQSHGGSSRQARTVISGEQPADVVTLGLFSDVDALRKRGLIASDWADRLPNHSRPYTSTIVFVVREGNPKKHSGLARFGAFGRANHYAGSKNMGQRQAERACRLGSDRDARRNRGGGASLSESLVRACAGNGCGRAERRHDLRGGRDRRCPTDLENEAIREVTESDGKLEIVYPPVSILAEPYVAWVDANVARRGTQAAAQAYLEFLFSDQAQATIASLGYRPYKEGAVRESSVHRPQITLFPISAVARDWNDAQQKFFAENGIIDTVIGSRP